MNLWAHGHRVRNTMLVFVVAGLLLLAAWQPRLAGAMTAVATAVAAIAAATAARETRQIAQDAREALGRTIRPMISVDVLQSHVILGRIMNAGPLDALDVSVNWRMSDGTHLRGHTPNLEAWRPTIPPGGDISLGVALPGISTVAEVLGSVDRVVIRYFDARRLCQWEDSWRPTPNHADRHHLGPPGWEAIDQRLL